MSGSIPFHYQGKPDSVTPQSLLDRQRKHPKNYEDQISFSGEVLLQDTKTLIYSAETEEQSVKSRTWCLNVGVFEGRYYFEVEVLEVPSHLMIGWFGIQCTVWYDVAYSLGLNPHGFMYDCSAGILWSYSLRPQSLGPPAKVGDRYGCELDANLKTVTFTHITPTGTKTVATLSAANCQLDAEDLFPLFPAVGLFGGKVKLFTNKTPGGPVLPVGHGLDQTIVSHFSSSNLPDPIKGGSDFCKVLISVLEKSYVRFLKEGAYTHLLAPCWNLLLSEPDIDASKVDEVGGFEGIVESFTKTYLLPFQINYFHHVFEEKDAEWARLVAKASQHSDQLNITDVRPISELERVIRKAVFLMNIPPNENEELSLLVSHEMGELINTMRPGVLAQVPAEEKDAILDYFFTTVLFPEFYQRYLGTPERPVSLQTGSEGIRKQLLQIKTNLQTPGVKSLFYALMNFNWPANLGSLFQPTKSMTEAPKLKDFSILRRELLEKIDFYLSEEASKVTISFPAAAPTQTLEPKVSPTAPNPNPLNVAPVVAVETQKNVAPSMSTVLPTQQKASQIPVQAQTLPDKSIPVKTEGTKVVPKAQSKESDTAALALFAGVGVVLLGAGLWWFISEKENK